MVQLTLKDFRNFEVKNSSQIKGGATEGGHHVVLMQSFDYGYDIVTTTNGVTTTAFCDITNSTLGNNGCGGPQCCPGNV
jgi:hypothetical protein